MHRDRQDLASIKVKTARMLEIYALLRSELAAIPQGTFPSRDVEQLHQAVRTVEQNMLELQKGILQAREQSSPGSSDARALDEILDAVMSWVREPPASPE